MAFTSFWAKLGISGAFIVGVFAFGRYYQESIMIRNEAQRECIFNEKLYHYQRENLTLQDKCNQLKQEIKELNFQIRRTMVNDKKNNQFYSLYSKLMDILSSNTENKEVEISAIANKLSEEASKYDKIQNGRRNLFLLLLIVLMFSVIGNYLLIDRNEALTSKIESLEYGDSLFKQFMEPDSASVFTYRVKGGKPVTYRQLMAEHDSLEAKYQNIDSLKEHYRIELGLVIRNYPIHFTKENDVYTIHAPQIDSALLLLPVYRDMIKFDKKTNTWSVGRVYSKRN